MRFGSATPSLDERRHQIQQRLMMNRNRVFRVKVCEPAKAEAQRSAGFFRFLHVLMKTLQRGDSKTLRRQRHRLAHHLSLVGAITV